MKQTFLISTMMLTTVNAFAVRNGDIIDPSLRREVVYIEALQQSCTGVIVGRNTVLTARHCVNIKDAKELKVDNVKIISILVPLEQTNSENILDLALIKVAIDVRRPIATVASKLPKSQTFKIYFYGYGQTSYDDQAKAQLRIGRNKISEDLPINDQSINFAFDYDNETMPYNSGALPGDSGGPLYVEGESPVIGIASKSIFNSTYVNLTGTQAKEFFSYAKTNGYDIHSR